MIYLSICIPTYNRSNYLSDTINSIISQPEFSETDEVEIIVSDNCSTDDTELVMQEFLTKYPSKIKYSRNPQNINDRNYEKVLSLGSGTILKLNNDTLLFDDGSLGKLLAIIKDCVDNGLTPFFLNGQQPHFDGFITCTNAADFINTTSYFCTWIGGFCIGKESFKKVENFSKDYLLLLVQVDVLMRLLKRGHKFLVIPDKLFISVSPPRKGGYNLADIFITNYFKILARYLTDKNEIKVLAKEKKNVLFKFLLPWLAKLRFGLYKDKVKFTFGTSNYQEIIKKEFSVATYRYFEICLVSQTCLLYLKSLIKN